MAEHLTEELLNTHHLEPEKRVELADDVEPGLFARLRLGKSGKRSVHFIWRRGGGGTRKHHYANLGPRVKDVFGLKEARKAAEKLNARLLLGQVEAVKKSKVPTLREAWETFREYRLGEDRVRPRTLAFYDAAAGHFLEAYDFVKINKISSDDCLRLHTRLGRTVGKRTANATIDLLGRVWEWSANRGHCDGRNPTLIVERYPIQVRRFDLDEDEVRRFFLAVEDDPLCDLWLLLAYTGCRKDNALAAHRGQFDLETKTWTIPAETAKGKQPILIQLVDEVVEIVQRSGDGWLFPAERSASGHRTNVAKDWKRIREKAQLPHWTVHTLRKLFATVARNAGEADKGIAADLLGHVDLSSQKAYAFSTAEGVRRAMEATVAEMKRISR